DSTKDQGNGIREAENGSRFLLTTEVEDKNRVHLLLFPSSGAAEDVYQEFQQFSSDIDREGRPRPDITGEEIDQVCKRNGVLIGPCHAFTPWTALYSKFDSLQGCCGNSTDVLSFLELGPSSDTSLADSISEHHDMTFVRFSDAHCPWPHRLGREFTRFELNELSFSELEKAFERKGGRKTTLNVGFDPREGKYHCTACNDCYQKYSLEQAERFGWVCQECGRTIKKGVRDRIQELADTDVGDSPDFRPRYVHLFPLAGIIQEVVGHSSPTTKTVQKIYDDFQERFSSEIDILTEKAIEELEGINQEFTDAVKKFRSDSIVIVPGGGGSYGELVIPSDSEEK
ncbi:MAG: phosphotransferase, partial [Candidatus Nanohaloarchaeota archaeon QJJ-7]|nr:phosphotransferase [Candidatus Nanohaloarchaeota archaeon QJJ-7]